MHLRPVSLVLFVVAGLVTTTWRKGLQYVDPGATAWDVYDGPCDVRTSGHVDVGRRGVYTVTYSAADRSGNVAIAYRKVVVR